MLLSVRSRSAGKQLFSSELEKAQQQLQTIEAHRGAARKKWSQPVKKRLLLAAVAESMRAPPHSTDVAADTTETLTFSTHPEAALSKGSRSLSGRAILAKLRDTDAEAPPPAQD